MAELKTKKTKASVEQFISTVEDEQKRDDCYALIKMIQKATGEKPSMWGAAIIGFGKYHLKYESGRELDWFQVGFSPRKQNLTIYILPGFAEENALLKKLGKYKTGKGCLYIKKLSDVNTEILQQLLDRSVKTLL
jgi:hypothetical protein